MRQDQLDKSEFKRNMSEKMANLEKIEPIIHSEKNLENNLKFQENSEFNQYCVISDLLLYSDSN